MHKNRFYLTDEECKFGSLRSNGVPVPGFYLTDEECKYNIYKRRVNPVLCFYLTDEECKYEWLAEIEEEEEDVFI